MGATLSGCCFRSRQLCRVNGRNNLHQSVRLKSHRYSPDAQTKVKDNMNRNERRALERAQQQQQAEIEAAETNALDQQPPVLPPEEPQVNTDAPLEAPQLPAPVAAEVSVSTDIRGQLSIDFLMPQDSKVFGTKPITDKNGNVVGYRSGLIKQAEIARNFELQPKKDKEAIALRKRDEQLKAMRKFKAWLASQPDEWILERGQIRTDKSGRPKVTVAIIEDKLPPVDAFRIAQTYYGHLECATTEWLETEGVRRVNELFAKEVADLRKQDVDVHAEVKPADEQKPEEQPA